MAPDTTVASTSNQTQEIPVASTVMTTVVVKPKLDFVPVAPDAREAGSPAAIDSPLGQLLERARSLIAGQKYAEAGALLASVKAEDLTAEQKNLWQALQTQIQKAMAERRESAGDQVKKSLSELIGK